MKRWYHSRTLWFNIVTVTPLMLDVLATNLSLIQPVVSAKWYPLIALGIAVGNAWLRIITTQAIASRKNCDEKKPEGQ